MRPECCPRSKETITHEVTDETDAMLDAVMGYQKGMSVLTIGDGDFTFSLAVARLVCAKNFGRVVATSYEDRTTLQNVYPDFDSTLSELQQHHVQVCYKVDATNLDTTLPRTIGNGQRYQRIIWNFPCTAISSGQDGQNSAMEENKELVRKFVRNALSYLTSDGEILMAHKTKPPYCQWGLEKVALEGLGGAESKRVVEFEYKGRVVFDKCLMKPYTPRKALDRKSFPCHDACVYVFGWKSKRGTDGEFKSTIPEEDGEGEHQVLAVKEEMIDELRSLHLGLSEVKQDHRQKNGNKTRRRK